MLNLEWYLADLKSTGKNTIETVEKSLTDMFIRLVRIYPCLIGCYLKKDIFWVTLTHILLTNASYFSIVCLMYKYTPNTVSAGLREEQYLKTPSLNNHVTKSLDMHFILKTFLNKEIIKLWFVICQILIHIIIYLVNPRKPFFFAKNFWIFKRIKMKSILDSLRNY